MKAYTDLKQSNKLAEILPIESADMWYCPYPNDVDWYDEPRIGKAELLLNQLPCWSLAALLNYIKDKCGSFELVYLNVYRLSTSVYDVYNNDPIDACYEMIIKLHEQNLL